MSKLLFFFMQMLSSFLLNCFFSNSFAVVRFRFVSFGHLNNFHFYIYCWIKLMHCKCVFDEKVKWRRYKVKRRKRSLFIKFTFIVMWFSCTFWVLNSLFFACLLWIKIKWIFWKKCQVNKMDFFKTNESAKKKKMRWRFI